MIDKSEAKQTATVDVSSSEKESPQSCISIRTEDDKPHLGQVVTSWEAIQENPDLLHEEESLRPMMTQKEETLNQPRIVIPLDFTPSFANTLKFGKHNQTNPRYAMKIILS